MVVLGWCVLFLVFVGELAAMAAFGIWGWDHEPRWLLVWLLPLAVMAVWYLFASPKALYGGRVVGPVVKVVVLGLAGWMLYDAGHPAWAVLFLVVTVAVNALATLPRIRVLADPG